MLPGLGSVPAGATLPLTWTVQNNGVANTPSTQWNDKIYLSTSPTWDNSARYVDTFVRPHGSAARAAYTQTQTVVVPGDLQPGNYYLYAYADADNAIYEYNAENNNTGRSAGTLSVTPRQGSTPTDLIIGSLDGPRTAVSGSPVNVSWAVTNTSGTPTGASSWTDGLYLSTDTNFNPGTDTRRYPRA